VRKQQKKHGIEKTQAKQKKRRQPDTLSVAFLLLGDKTPRASLTHIVSTRNHQPTVGSTFFNRRQLLIAQRRRLAAKIAAKKVASLPVSG